MLGGVLINSFSVSKKYPNWLEIAVIYPRLSASTSIKKKGSCLQGAGKPLKTKSLFICWK
jgi:hypothetical protein